MAKYAERLWNPGDDAGAHSVARIALPDASLRTFRMNSERSCLPSATRRRLPLPMRSPCSHGPMSASEHAGRFLNHLLIRSESISSSWIEGNRVTPKEAGDRRATESGQPGRAGCRRERPCDRDGDLNPRRSLT